MACGWYHTVVVARQKWTTSKPIEFDKVALKDPDLLTTEEVHDVIGLNRNRVHGIQKYQEPAINASTLCITDSYTSSTWLI